MSKTRLYISHDTSAQALGANAVAAQFKHSCGDAIKIIRTGSRGMFWLEPMVEVDTEHGRIAYGPVQPNDVAELLASNLLQGGTNPTNYLGLVDDIPFLKMQQRLTFARVGVVDPLSIKSYCEQQGFEGLHHALKMQPQAIVDDIKKSGLRGRGGAAFPTGIKWQTVLDTPSAQKYVVCNADEGDSGTFADRMLMEGDPMSLIEGMLIAGLATEATQGYIYLREEYPYANTVLNAVIKACYAEGYLGDNILGSGKHFSLEVRLGAGAYICGEETAMLDSIEGKRGMVRSKPPLPAVEGLFGKPTVINNVISLATVPTIFANGASHYASFGMGQSKGTMPFQLAGNIKQGGLVELAFGATLRELLFKYGGGTRSGKPMRAVQVGGPLGAYLPEQQWDTALDYEAFTKINAVLGHGGIVAFDSTVDMQAQARFSMAFCAEESCGKCTPCRIGSTRGVEIIDHMAATASPHENAQQLELLRELCDTMVDGSLCAMGSMTPYPVLSALNYFSSDFGGENSASVKPVQEC
jgi:formate dehydrogenase iron-sulfur subunit